ncbi:hypothetical protein [Sphingomonas sp. LHG3406-1]|uniref:hypothetical protein n=1 Tax=Sphingomonas sp. LHG3406-1 TaxID=2804617 RepID=UPI00262C7145|nr:hypothetical protein [Sphingomonas sp. LHG3406-1]
MSFQNMPPAGPRPGDSPQMTAALDRLMVEGADARRPVGNDHQIKVTWDINYYPDKGTILPDRGSKLAVFGLDALIKYLRETGRLPATQSV